MTLPGMLTGDGTVLVQKAFVTVSINTSESRQVRNRMKAPTKLLTENPALRTYMQALLTLLRQAFEYKCTLLQTEMQFS